MDNSEKKKRISLVDFVTVYLDVYDKDGTKYDVARRLNIPMTSIDARLALLKKHGRDLPRFRSNKQLRTIEELNEIDLMLAQRRMKRDER